MDPRALVRYNHFLRRRFAAFFVDEVDWETLVEDHETSHQTIANVFVHGCNMEDWLLHYVMAGKTWDGPAYDGFTSAEAIAERVAEVEARTTKLLNGLTDDDLAREHTLDYGGGHTLTLPLADILTEVVMEDTHHRGEVLAMLWRKDITPPYVSYAEWASQG